MAQLFQIDFKIRSADRDHSWISVDQLNGKSSAWVDGYLRVENLHCCDFQGGFFIDVDGQPWSDDGTVDEFWMTVTWFTALKEILAGKSIAKAYPWEESNLTLTRAGDELTLEDVHSSGQVAMPKIDVSLFEFVEGILREGEKFSALVNEIRREVKARHAGDVSDEIEVKLKEIEKNLPEALEQEIQALATRLRTSRF